MPRFGVRQLQSFNKNWGNPIVYGLCALSEPLGDMSQTKFTDMSACARCFFEVSTPGWFELWTLKSVEIRYGDERERKAGIQIWEANTIKLHWRLVGIKGEIFCWRNWFTAYLSEMTLPRARNSVLFGMYLGGYKTKLQRQTSIFQLAAPRVGFGFRDDLCPGVRELEIRRCGEYKSTQGSKKYLCRAGASFPIPTINISSFLGLAHRSC